MINKLYIKYHLLQQLRYIIFFVTNCKNHNITTIFNKYLKEIENTKKHKPIKNLLIGLMTKDFNKIIKYKNLINNFILITLMLNINNLQDKELWINLKNILNKSLEYQGQILHIIIPIIFLIIFIISSNSIAYYISYTLEKNLLQDMILLNSIFIIIMGIIIKIHIFITNKLKNKIFISYLFIIIIDLNNNIIDPNLILQLLPKNIHNIFNDIYNKYTNGLDIPYLFNQYTNNNFLSLCNNREETKEFLLIYSKDMTNNYENYTTKFINNIINIITFLLILIPIILISIITKNLL